MYKMALRRIALVTLLVAGLAACAGIGKGSTQDPQLQVGELASARWQALLAGDLKRAYDYLSPGTRETMSLDQYKRKINPGLWKKAAVSSVSCEQERCGVVVVLDYSFGSMKSIETRLDEVWLMDNGKWWYVPQR